MMSDRGAFEAGCRAADASKRLGETARRIGCCVVDLCVMARSGGDGQTICSGLDFSGQYAACRGRGS